MTVKTISEETNKKILEHKGWDFCEHDTIRRFCKECKIDVPALWRKDDNVFFPEIKKQLGLGFFDGIVQS